MFNVTYSIVTPESAEYGDYDETGFIAKGVCLREAARLVYETRTSRCDGVSSIEASEWPVINPRWIDVCNGVEYETGAYESRSLHFPESMTPASKRRVCRLFGINTVTE